MGGYGGHFGAEGGGSIGGDAGYIGEAVSVGWGGKGYIERG